MIWKVKPFVLGIVTINIELAFLILLEVATKTFGDVWIYISMFCFLLPGLVLSLVSLIGGIKRMRFANLRKEGVATIIIASVSLATYVLVAGLIVFVIATGGRLPHQIFY